MNFPKYNDKSQGSRKKLDILACAAKRVSPLSMTNCTQSKLNGKALVYYFKTLQSITSITVILPSNNSAVSALQIFQAFCNSNNSKHIEWELMELI